MSIKELLCGVAYVALSATAALDAFSVGVVRIGVLPETSGTYPDPSGPSSVCEGAGAAKAGLNHVTRSLAPAWAAGPSRRMPP